MTKDSLICFFLLFLINHSLATLNDGIVTLSWSINGSSPVIDRFLSNETLIKLNIRCQSLSTSNSQGQLQDYKKTDYANTKVQIRGRIGRFVKCLPLSSDTFMTTSQITTKNAKELQNEMQTFYDSLWDQMERKSFVMQTVSCNEQAELYFDEYSNLKPPTITQEQANDIRKSFLQKGQPANNQKNSKVRRAAVDETKMKTVEQKTPLANAVNQKSDKRLRTWADGYYLIELSQPVILEGASLDVDVVVSMINRHGGYLTADEYPALVFYGVMCGIYALFALLWFVWCAFYWRELLKIQFWIGGVILIGMIEKSAFIAEYDTVNRHGYKVHFAIVTAEILSCLKRTVSRMLVIIVALGYGIVKPRLGPLKQKVFAMGIFYFTIATIEALLRVNTKNDETNNKVLISRIPLAVVDATIYYWTFTSLVSTARTLRLRKNIVKLNVYRHFTNTIIFAIIASLIFMIWSLKSHVFTDCITDWKEFWVDDAFWHILFSLILFVILFLFRPSNNNQRYAFVPLLDESENDDEFDDDDEEKGESAVFDSVTMRKAASMENGAASKNKRQQQALLNREANVSSSGANDLNGNGAVEDALTWVEDNIPTSIADQALQALDSEDEIVNTKLERSKMQ